MSTHYSNLHPQPITVIESWNLDHHCATALAYIARAPYKGEQIRDLRKAIWYLKRRVQVLQAIEQGRDAPEPDSQV